MAGTEAKPLNGTRALVVSNERVGERMAGPAIRSLNLAQQLAQRGAQVTLAAPEVSGDVTGLDRPAVREFGFPSAKAFAELTRAHDVVVTQPQRVDVAVAMHRVGTPVVYDLYVPSFVERVAQLASEPMDQGVRADLLERDRLEYAAALRLGSAFICASERQKDHWLGGLGAVGRFDVGIGERDPRGDVLCGVVPFGVPDEPAPQLADGEGALRGKLVEPDAIPLLWTGGLWNWFDPVTLVEGLARAREREPRLQLVVMGVHHPEAAWEEQDASRAMRERAQELGLLDGGRAAGVVLCDAWIPYAERHRFLLDADAGVGAHHDALETRLSFRTRLLDHLWAGLPTISTAGGDLVTRLAERGAALTVPDGNTAAWEQALLDLAARKDSRDELLEMRAAARALGEELRWSRVTEPLARSVAWVAEHGDVTSRRPLTAPERAAYATLLVRVRAKTKGFGSLAGAVRQATSR